MSSKYPLSFKYPSIRQLTKNYNREVRRKKAMDKSTSFLYKKYLKALEKLEGTKNKKLYNFRINDFKSILFESAFYNGIGFDRKIPKINPDKYPVPITLIPLEHIPNRILSITEKKEMKSALDTVFFFGSIHPERRVSAIELAYILNENKRIKRNLNLELKYMKQLLEIKKR